MNCVNCGHVAGSARFVINSLEQAGFEIVEKKK